MTGELWGVYCEYFEKIDRIITALHCTYVLHIDISTYAVFDISTYAEMGPDVCLRWDSIFVLQQCSLSKQIRNDMDQTDGGSILYLSDNIKTKPHSDLKSSIIETLWVELTWQSLFILPCSCWRPSSVGIYNSEIILVPVRPRKHGTMRNMLV